MRASPGDGNTCRCFDFQALSPKVFDLPRPFTYVKIPRNTMQKQPEIVCPPGRQKIQAVKKFKYSWASVGEGLRSHTSEEIQARSDQSAKRRSVLKQ